MDKHAEPSFVRVQKIGREAQVWRQLNHENIVALRGFCILSNRLPGLVMDVYRWNLKDFVRENSLSVGDDLELVSYPAYTSEKYKS